MTVIDVILGMRATLASPASWTKGFSARTSNGDACEPRNPAAVCWCIGGALERQTDDEELREATEHALLVVLHQELNRTELQELAPFNDGRFTSHADVLDLLSRARVRVSASVSAQSSHS